jgi:microcystin-dependent protein
MVRLGYVTRPQLEGVLNDTPPSRVGRALVEKNLMQAHDLWKCVTEQVSEEFSSAGSTIPHENMQPVLAVNFIIALEGIFPSRN